MNRPIGLVVPTPMSDMHETKQRLIVAGLGLMLRRGYNAVGVQELLALTGVPKGSFYHQIRQMVWSILNYQL